MTSGNLSDSPVAGVPDVTPPTPEAPGLSAPIADELFLLQLTIARRADALAQAERPPLRTGSDRRHWIKAEREILGPASRIALIDLLRLCAGLSRPPQGA